MGLKRKIRTAILNKKYKDVVFSGGVNVDDSCAFGGKNYIGRNTQLINCKMGYASYCASNSFLRNAVIGRYCCIGKHVRIIDVTHPAREYVSIHPAFYAKKNVVGLSFAKADTFKEKLRIDGTDTAVEIGNDVWICDGAQLIGGIRIGNGAIIAAGAVVTQDVPDYAVYGGVPAKLIRYRFEQQEIEFLKKLAWWDKDKEWLKAHSAYFGSVKELKAHIDKEDQ